VGGVECLKYWKVGGCPRNPKKSKILKLKKNFEVVPLFVVQLLPQVVVYAAQLRQLIYELVVAIVLLILFKNEGVI